MRMIDRILQRWRERKASRWVPVGSRVLDIGCHQGEFLKRLGGNIRESVGLDPLCAEVNTPTYRLIRESFHEGLPFANESFDVVVMLATLEHIRAKEPLARECRRLLRPGGRVIITVPSPRVDGIVHTLARLGLADGMSLDEHHGFDPLQTASIFAQEAFVVEHHRSFQLGLNHLYVLSSPSRVLVGSSPP